MPVDGYVIDGQLKLHVPTLFGFKAENLLLLSEVFHEMSTRIFAFKHT